MFEFDCNKDGMSWEGYYFREIITCFESFGQTTPQDVIVPCS